MTKMVRNYLEHEEKVKYMEAVFNKDHEWQWFIDCIEANFEIREVKSWVEYTNQRHSIEEIFSYFLKIVESGPTELNFRELSIKEIYLIAEYFQGKKIRAEVQSEITFNFAKILLLIVWLTKIENQDNDTNYITDMRILVQNNIFLLLNIQGLSFYEKEILEYLDTIIIEDVKSVKKVLFDNINMVKYSPNIEFLESCRKQIINANVFDHTSIENKPSNLTWEEDMLLSMLEVSISDNKLVPMVQMGGTMRPNIEEWTKERLENLKDFFNLDLSDFIIETIKYILFKIIPSQKIIDIHIELVLNQLDTGTSLYEKYGCSSFKIVSYLFRDKKLLSEKKKCLMIKFSEMKDIEEIKELNKNYIPLSKEQKEILKDYYDECYRQLDNVNADYEFSEYLKNTDVVKSINNDYFVKVSKTFYKLIKENQRMCADLFIRYMQFLIRLNFNQNIDKEYVKFEMIRIQKLWECEYYDICCSNLHEFSHKIEIKSEDVEQYNDSILSNIFVIANTCMITKNEEFIEIMETVSKYAISHLVSKVHYTKRFPIRDEDCFRYEQHDIDELMKEVVEKILINYGYKFLNTMNTDVYVKAISDRIQENALLNFQFFHKVKELYVILIHKLRGEYNLIKFDDEVTVAHLMQLFPLLEIKIKELGTMYNIFPYKEDEKHFMESKDPSSILRVLLKEVYTETQGFEVAPDILFVYNYMYNGNSLNIRNECVHGRDYLSGGSLIFAFKVTLASLLMVMKRIEILLERSKQKDND